MHYRTERVSFLEPADSFLERMPDVWRVEGSSFETDELGGAGGGGTLAVVPAAP